jgi:hypothetical protein
MARQYTIYDCHELARNKNAQCLSGRFVAMQSPLTWMCNKHKLKFETSLTGVFNGKWCEACSLDITPKVASGPEPIAKTIYEKAYVAMKNITNKEFAPIKPKWLYGLELDGYNEELDIAYVIKTAECYKSMMGVGSIEQYIEYLAKKEICLENDVTLIEIPYWVTEIEDYLSDKLDA